MKAGIYKNYGSPDIIPRKELEKHSTTQSILLHLFPGILVGGFYFLVRQPVANMGYPSIFALLLAFAFVLIPIELGFLFYQGKKKTGHFNLQGIICYRDTIPWWGNTLCGQYRLLLLLAPFLNF